MMESINQLAFFGGKPAFKETLHIGQPNLGDKHAFLSRIEQIWEKRWLTNDGICVNELESNIQKLLGFQHCIAVCNATTALEITIRALGMTGEVIIPSFTFVATAHSLQWQEITPVFCDIDLDTHSIDPDQIERLITPRTTGIVAVHIWGQACNISRLTELARQYDLKLIFDAAHAFGASYQGEMIGNFGDAEVFSLHATKFINSFEGGIIATNNSELAEKIRLMKNFGFLHMDKVIHLGINGKMSEASAAMGLTSLDSMDGFIAANKRNYHLYKNNLTNLKGCKIYQYDEQEKLNYQYVIIEIDSELAGIDRDQVLALLHAENIRVRRYFYPGCHRMEPYASYYPNAHLLLGNTEKLSQKVLCLPTGNHITESQIAKICSILRFILEKGAQISSELLVK